MEVQMEISIPTDDDGFVLLKCSFCGDYFKLTPLDMEDDEILHIHCPYCGQVSESYLTEDVIEVAMTKAQNFTLDQMHQDFKKLERKYKHGSVTFKAGKTPKKKYESPVLVVADTLTKQHYDCCNREVKIKPSIKIAGTYCPFCGVKDFEDN